jgi:hypothetical protein
MSTALQPNATKHLLAPPREGEQRLSRVARWLVGYKVEEVERELIPPLFPITAETELGLPTLLGFQFEPCATKSMNIRRRE